MRARLMAALVLISAGLVVTVPGSGPPVLDGSVVRAERAGQQGIEALVGIWRIQKKPNVKYTTESHMRFQLKGREIVVIVVIDKDDPEMNNVKGDEYEWGRFKLNGRRIVGKLSLKDKRPLHGI